MRPSRVPRLRPLLPTELDDEQAAVHASITASRPEATPGGPLPGPFDAMLRAPRSGHALAGLGDALRNRGVLPERIRELAILQVAAHEGSAFEWWTHAVIAARLGWPAAVVDAVAAGTPPEPDDPAERAAAAAVTELLATGDLADRGWSTLLDALGEAGAVELLTLVGYYRVLALQMRVLRID